MQGGVHEDLSAERAVLGAILADNGVLANVAAVVAADDFSNPAHSQIWEAVLALDGKQQKIDHLTLLSLIHIFGPRGFAHQNFRSGLPLNRISKTELYGRDLQVRKFHPLGQHHTPSKSRAPHVMCVITGQVAHLVRAAVS